MLNFYKSLKLLINIPQNSSYMASLYVVSPIPRRSPWFSLICVTRRMDPHMTPQIDSAELPREVRVDQLRDILETLQIADEVAAKGYLITSSELADLMDINASAVTSRGDHWVWRNWVVSRVRREGNQILWQLERVD